VQSQVDRTTRLAPFSGRSTTPYVGYQYDDTSTAGRFSKGLRPTALHYPNSRLVHNTYGDSGSTADAMSRIDATCDDASGSPGEVLAKSGYLGGRPPLPLAGEGLGEPGRERETHHSV
jgi:hypothetical protein